MARRVRDKNIESREARRKLKVSGKPYWKTIGLGLHLGYRKGKTGGVWVVRRYLGNQAYKVKRIAVADDGDDANGLEILDFWQAQEQARNMRGSAMRRGPYSVGQAVADYLDEHLEGRASAYDVGKRLRAFVLPAFGDKPVADLTAEELRQWHRDIARQPARARTKAGAPQNYRKSEDDPEAARCLSLFKAVLNYAWIEGRAEVGAWPRVKPFKGVDLPRTRYLTIAECKRLINASDGDFRVLVRAALETGARYQELARLRVSDFNPDAGANHVRKSKRNRSWRCRIWELPSAIASSKSNCAFLPGTQACLTSVVPRSCR